MPGTHASAFRSLLEQINPCKKKKKKVVTRVNYLTSHAGLTSSGQTARSLRDGASFSGNLNNNNNNNDGDDDLISELANRRAHNKNPHPHHQDTESYAGGEGSGLGSGFGPAVSAAGVAGPLHPRLDGDDDFTFPRGIGPGVDDEDRYAWSPGNNGGGAGGDAGDGDQGSGSGEAGITVVDDPTDRKEPQWSEYFFTAFVTNSVLNLIWEGCEHEDNPSLGGICYRKIHIFNFRGTSKPLI
jgi:hypothetical protein